MILLRIIYTLRAQSSNLTPSINIKCEKLHSSQRMGEIEEIKWWNMRKKKEDNNREGRKDDDRLKMSFGM